MVDSTGSADGSLGRKDKHRKAFSLSALPAFLSLSLKSSSQENNSASSGGSNILASSNSSNGLAVTSLFSGQSPPPSQQHLPGRASGSRSGATSPQMQVASSNSRLSSGFSDAEIDRSPIPMVNVLRSGQSSSNNSAGAEGAPDLKGNKATKLRGLREFFRLLRWKSKYSKTSEVPGDPVSAATAQATTTAARLIPAESSSISSSAATSHRKEPSEISLEDAVVVTTLNDVHHDASSKRLSFEEVLIPAFTLKYVVQEMLGEGAYGFVCSAEMLETGTQVAVKFIEKDKLRSSSWVSDTKHGRIPIEVKVLKTLSHPNIIHFYDYFEDADYCYLVTELGGSPWDSRSHHAANLAGTMKKMPANKTYSSSLGKDSGSRIGHGIKRRTSGDLFEFVDQFTFIEYKTVKKIFRQVISAVKYMHNSGFTHKDIKDENILVDVNYAVKLCDFGSAAPIPDAPAKYFRVFTGTWNYAPPEILCGNSYRGPECDIWACGSLLFILLFNQNPFQTPQDTIEKPLLLPLPVSQNCKKLLCGMLHKDLRKRMTVDDVALDPWLWSDED